MQGKSGNAVGAGDDGNSRIVENFGHLEELLKGIEVALVHALGNGQASVQEAATDLGGKPVCNGRSKRRHLSRTVSEYAFEYAESRIYDRLVLQQKLDKVFDLVR